MGVINRVLVVVLVVVKNAKGQCLVMRRKNVVGGGEWGFPGGKLEFGESLEEAAGRELLEETGVKGKYFKVISLSNQRNYLKDGMHTLIVGMELTGVVKESDVEIIEKDKCDGLIWFDGGNVLAGQMTMGSRQVLEAMDGKGQEILLVDRY
jgi:8-oxo-dGTP diphosphatase